jgi:hypothetical protein
MVYTATKNSSSSKFMYCQSGFSFYLKFVSLPKADVPNKYSHFEDKIVKSILFYNEGRKANTKENGYGMACLM